MKNNKILNSVILLIVLVLFGIYIYYLNNEIAEYKDRIKILENKYNNSFEESKNNNYEYDCTFTETYRIVNTLDNYIAEIPELSYIIVDKFQSHSAYSYQIPTNLKKEIEVNKYYEFTYHLKGTGIINNMDDVYSYMIKTATENISEPEMKVTLTIKETDKEGLAQINEPICK